MWYFTGWFLVCTAVLLVLLAFMARNSAFLSPVILRYDSICRWVIRKWPGDHYTAIEKLALVVPFFFTSILAAKLGLSWTVLLALVSIALAWFASSLEATYRSYRKELEYADLVSELAGTVDENRRLRMQVTEQQAVLREIMERRLSEICRFSGNQRASVYVLQEEAHNDFYYLLVARFSNNPRFRRSKQVFKELSCRIGVLARGHEQPIGDYWQLPESARDDSEARYKEIESHYGVPRALAETITMQCETICVCRFTDNTHTLGLIVVESLEPELEMAKRRLTKLIRDTELITQVKHFRKEYFGGYRPMSSMEVRQWEKDLSTEQKSS